MPVVWKSDGAGICPLDDTFAATAMLSFKPSPTQKCTQKLYNRFCGGSLQKIITPQRGWSNDETPFFCGEFPSEMLWQLHDRPNGLRMLTSLSLLREWRMGMTVVFND